MIENPRVGQRVWHVPPVTHYCEQQVIENTRPRPGMLDHVQLVAYFSTTTVRELYATKDEAAAALEEQAHQLLARARELRETAPTGEPPL